MKRIKVTGIESDMRQRSYDAKKWICDDGKNRREVYEDTKENERRLKALNAAVNKRLKLEQELERQEKDIQDKIVVLDPWKYKIQK